MEQPGVADSRQTAVALPLTRRGLRIVGWSAIAYAILGALLLGVAGLLGGRVVDEAEALTRSAGSSLRAAASTVEDTADAFKGFDASLARAGLAAAEASILVRTASATMERLAASLDIRIFGTQPLQPLQEDAELGAEQLSAVADELDELTAALVANRGEVTTIRHDLERLAMRLDDLRERLSPTTTGPSDSGDPATSALRLLLIVSLAWVGVPTIGSLWLGIYLLRLTALPIQA